MKRVIFSIFDQIETTTDLDVGGQHKMLMYYDKLVENKKQYAESIGAEFIMYKDTFKDNVVDSSQFTNINLYKHYLFDKLAHEYDEVMYVDHDVVFNTDKNVFEEIDLSKGVAVKDSNKDILYRDIDANNLWKLSERNPNLKYFITKELLGGKECNVINTGIMIGKSAHIKKIKLTKRIKAIAKKIEKLTDETHLIKKMFYPNNEAVFSYIIEHYKVPYQLMDEQWHDIRNERIKEQPYGNLIHFINKNFDNYFNDRTKVIFSIYIDIPKSKLDNAGSYNYDNIGKSERTKLQLAEYNDKLIENKKQYAEHCGADWKLFGNGKKFKEFAKRFKNLTLYNIINLWKIQLTYELAEQYDNVLYLDFDVVAYQNIDFFKYNDVDQRICCQADYVKNPSGVNMTEYPHDFRSIMTKYWNCHAMLLDHEIEPEPYVYNTGILGASKRVLDQLDFVSDLDQTIDMMDEIKFDDYSFYPPALRKQFGHDNESIFGYKVHLNKVAIDNMKGMWHYKMNAANHNPGPVQLQRDNPVLVHVINKRFQDIL